MNLHDGFPSLLAHASDTPNRGTGYGHAERVLIEPVTFVARKRCGCAVYTFQPNVDNQPILSRAVARLTARGGWVEPVRDGAPQPSACPQHWDAPWREVGA